MTKRKLSLISAVLAGAFFALPAAAAGPNSPTDDSSDRGVITPHSVQDQTVFEQRIPGGTPVMPEQRDPLNPNRVVPFVQQPEGVRPLVQGFHPTLVDRTTLEPVPVLVDPAHITGMEGAPIGATR